MFVVILIYWKFKFNLICFDGRKRVDKSQSRVTNLCSTVGHYLVTVLRWHRAPPTRCPSHTYEHRANFTRGSLLAAVLLEPRFLLAHNRFTWVSISNNKNKCRSLLDQRVLTLTPWLFFFSPSSDPLLIMTYFHRDESAEICLVISISSIQSQHLFPLS